MHVGFYIYIYIHLFPLCILLPEHIRKVFPQKRKDQKSWNRRWVKERRRQSPSWWWSLICIAKAVGRKSNASWNITKVIYINHLSLILSAIDHLYIKDWTLWKTLINADSLILLSGVEDVTIDYKADELTVIGNVDPAAVRDKVADKIKRKVEIVSTLAPKKEEGEKKATTPPPPSPALPKEVMFKFHTFSPHLLLWSVWRVCTFITLKNKLVRCYF